MQVIKRKPLIDGFSEEGIIPSSDKKTQGKIELAQVGFAYPSRPNIQVCKGYNLTINPGETVALVGPSGCRKVVSTFLKCHVMLYRDSIFPLVLIEISTCMLLKMLSLPSSICYCDFMILNRGASVLMARTLKISMFVGCAVRWVM